MSTFLPNTHAIARLDQGSKSLLVVIDGDATLPFFYHCTDPVTHARYTIHEHQLMPIQNVPARHKRHMFDEVAHVIGAALDAWPSPIEVDPGALAVETYARRFREARDAKRLYGYTHPKIDEAKFALHGDMLSTSMSDGFLIVGPRDALREHVKATGHCLATPGKTKGVHVDVPVEHLESVVCLLHARIFPPDVLFFVTNATPGMITSLEERYDVVFNPLEDEPNKLQIL